MNFAVQIAFIYGVVAALATLANLAAQSTVIWAYEGDNAIVISIAFGTIVGAPVKYLLEKRYIFDFKSESLSHDGRIFVIYSFLGVFTTAIFWSIEFAFQYLFDTDLMRYIGGAIGLTLSYIIKYYLDRRFVFVNKVESPMRVCSLPVSH